MKLINLFFWIITGCKVNFAGISAGAAIAAGVSAAGAIGGAVIQGQAAGKAGKGQAEAARVAALMQQQAAEQANQVADKRFNEDIANQNRLLAQARGDLQPYSDAGLTARNQLSALMADPVAFRQAASPEEQARLEGLFTSAKTQKESLNSQLEQLNKAILSSDRAPTTSQPGQTDNPIWEEIISGFDAAHRARFGMPMNRSWNADADANNQYQQLLAIYNQKVKALKDNQENLTKQSEAADIAANKAQQDFLFSKGAKEAGPGDLNRYFNEQDYMNDPRSGGHPMRDLTQNFDEDAFLAQGGKTKADLIKDFDEDAFLAKGGKTKGDLFRDFTLKDFNVDPGYNFRQEEGQKAIERSAASQGNQLSGATMRALARYGQDLGSQEYGAAFNRFGQQQQTAGNALNDEFTRFGSNRSNLSGELNNAFTRFGSNRENAANVYGNIYDTFNNERTNRFNRLASLSGQGQVAATNLGGYSQNFAGMFSNSAQNNANLVGSNLTGAARAGGEFRTQEGNANAAGLVGRANAFGQGFEGVSGAVNQGINNFQQNRFLNRLLDNGSSGRVSPLQFTNFRRGF